MPVNLPILSTSESIVNKINGSAQEIVTKVTNSDLISTAGKGVDGILKDLGDLVGVVPLAGDKVGYVFKKGGEAVKVVAVTGNNVVIGSGSTNTKVPPPRRASSGSGSGSGRARSSSNKPKTSHFKKR